MVDLAAVTADEPVRPGQYLLVATDAWWMATIQVLGQPERYRYLGEVIMREWIPPDPASDWLIERENTGGRIWIEGSEEQAARSGTEINDSWPTGRWQASYGDFFAADAGRAPAPPAEPSWQTPTRDFLAALPRDPSRLLARLQADSPGNRPGYTGAFVYATDALRSGLVAADLRAALYQALLALDGTELSEPGPEPGGHIISLSLDDGPRRREILIDSSNGQFAGQRDTMVQDAGGLRAGTVTSSTTVITTVVDGIGAAPRPR